MDRSDKRHIMIYLLVFFSSTLIMGVTENKHKSIRVAGMILATSLPILLATLRADSVGIDVMTYMKPLYLCSERSESISAFLYNMKQDPALQYLDYGYAFIGYFASKLFGGLWGIFFVNALLCYIPVLQGIRQIRIYQKNNQTTTRPIPYWASMFVYYCLFYNNSLNQVRQLITCALLFYAFTVILNRKYFKAILPFLLSCTIHVASIIFVYVVIIYLIVKSKNSVLKAITVAALFVFLVFSIQIFYALMNVLNRFGLVGDKYQNEIFDVNYGERNLNLSWLFICLCTIVINGIYYYKNRKEVLSGFLFFMSLSFLSLFNISSYFSSFGRLQLYFMIYSVVSLPLTFDMLKGLIKERKLISDLTCIAVPLVYWIVAVYLLDYTGSLSYQFAF